MDIHHIHRTGADMKFDLKALTRKELEKLRGDIEKALDKIADVEKKAALAAAEKAARAYGYSLVDRITSYNVCYTKLLRLMAVDRRGVDHFDLHRLVGIAMPFATDRPGIHLLRHIASYNFV